MVKINENPNVGLSDLVYRTTQPQFSAEDMAALYEKIHSVANEAGWIEKANQVSYAGTKYNYTSEAQFLAVMRPLFEEYGLIIYPEDCSYVDVDRPNEDKSSYLTTIVMKYRIADIETGAYITTMVPAQGSDRTDKGVYKALTGAYKAVLRQAFMVGTGDDPEATDESGKSVSSNNDNSDPLFAQKKSVIGQFSKLGLGAEERAKVKSILESKNVQMSVDKLPDDKDQLKRLWQAAKDYKNDSDFVQFTERLESIE